MKSKKIMLTLMTSVALLGLAACMPQSQRTNQSNQQTSQSSEELSSSQIQQVLDHTEVANKKLISSKMKAEISLTGGTDQVNNQQTMLGQIIYNQKSKKLAMASLVIEGSEDGQESYQEVVMPGGSEFPFYRRDSKTGSWSKEVMSNTTGYTVYPDYFKLLEGLYTMSQDLDMKETDSDYILTLKSQNTDLISLFGDEFQLELNGVTQAEMDKVLEAKIDKKTHFLKSFKLGLSYDGDKGNLDIKAGVSYSDWNEIEESDIRSLVDGEKG